MVILLVLKLQLGRAVREPAELKPAKKLSPTVVMLCVSKLQLGRLVSAQYSELKEEKK